jgi:hypothetical protein
MLRGAASGTWKDSNINIGEHDRWSMQGKIIIFIEKGASFKSRFNEKSTITNQD